MICASGALSRTAAAAELDADADTHQYNCGKREDPRYDEWHIFNDELRPGLSHFHMADPAMARWLRPVLAQIVVGPAIVIVLPQHPR